MAGFERLADGLDIMTRLARPELGAGYVIDDWRVLSPSVIDKGRVKIFPLARVTGDDPSAREQFALYETDLSKAGIHYFGGDMYHAERLASPEDGYGRRLAQAGIRVSRRTYIWPIRDYAVVYVLATEEDGQSLSLHVIPREWVWPRPGHARRDESRRRTMEKQLAAADPSWEWPA
jgi:hypothetical protein